jgi:CRP-like cAMP-binding protein
MTQELLFNEGDPGDKFYIILTGEIEASGPAARDRPGRMG